MARFLPVSSSALLSIKYEREQARLVVQFSEDAFYEYSGVPGEVVLDVLFADSIGSAFATLIKKPGFSYRKIPARQALA